MIDRHSFDAVNDELERYDCLLKASEDWAPQYAKDDTSHAKLIRYEARLEKKLRAYFRGLAEKADKYINWNAYRQVQAYDIDVVVNDSQQQADGQEFITVTFDTLALITGVGAAAGETIYKIPLGIQSTDAIIQQLTTQQVAFLVGKKVTKDGQMVDNPNAKYRITDTTRENIRKSIQTSIAQGEDQAAAVARLQKTIANPARASLIASTEAVNAYSNGILEFGKQSGAVGKVSEDLNAVDVCAEYAALGPVPLNYLFGGEKYGPTYHGRCRCGLRLIYPGQAEAQEIKL